MTSKPKRFVLTGGSGFIGRVLIVKLHAMFPHAQIVTIDRSQHTHSVAETVTGDFGDTNLLQKTIQVDDIVIHLACHSTPGRAEQDQVLSIQEVTKTINLLNVCQEKNIRKIVFLSSGGTVYGSERFIPFRETDLCRPINTHGIMKRTIEDFFKLYWKLHGLPYVILRVSNAYGRKTLKQHNLGLIDVFLGCLSQDKPLQVWGDGKTIRDYIHVEDLTDLMCAIIQSDITNETFNVGTGVGTSILGVIEILRELHHNDVVVNTLPPRGFDIPYNVLDMTLVGETFDWSPSIAIKEGIESMYNTIVKQVSC